MLPRLFSCGWRTGSGNEGREEGEKKGEKEGKKVMIGSEKRERGLCTNRSCQKSVPVKSNGVLYNLHNLWFSNTLRSPKLQSPKQHQSSPYMAK